MIESMIILELQQCMHRLYKKLCGCRKFYLYLIDDIFLVEI